MVKVAPEPGFVRMSPESTLQIAKDVAAFETVLSEHKPLPSMTLVDIEADSLELESEELAYTPAPPGVSPATWAREIASQRNGINTSIAQLETNAAAGYAPSYNKVAGDALGVIQGVADVRGINTAFITKEGQTLLTDARLLDAHHATITPGTSNWDGDPGIEPPARVIPRGLREVDARNGSVDLASGNYNTSLTGGIWNYYKAYGKEANAFNAEPILNPADFLEADQVARDLIGGQTIQEILRANPNLAGAINDAYELLGISDRQIKAYAQAAAAGHYDFITEAPTTAGRQAYQLLQIALQERYETDQNAPEILRDFPKSGEFRVSIVYLQYQGNFGGALDAVRQGAQAANVYWYPDSAAYDMVHGTAFQGRSKNLALTNINATAVSGGALEEKIGYAANDLKAILAQPLTAKSVTEAFYDAAILSQALGPRVNQELRALGTTSGYRSASQLAALYSEAVNKALASYGVTGISAEQIGVKLLAMIESPAFNAATRGNAADSQRAYSLVAFFDPQSLQAAAVGRKLLATPNEPKVQAAYQNTMSRLLQELAASPASPPSVAAFNANKASAGPVIGQWTVASLRWFLAAFLKTKGLAFTPQLEAATAKFNQLYEYAIEHSRPVDPSHFGHEFYYYAPNGANIGGTADAALNWAMSESGLARLAPNAVTSWLDGSGKTIAKAIDTIGLGAIAAVVGSTTTRVYRLFNQAGYHFDGATTAQLVAGIVGDAGILIEWATQENRFGAAPAGLSQIATAVAHTQNGLHNLASYLGLGNIVQAAELPVNVEASTPIGQFFNWALPQAGGFSNLIYGGFNIGQGIKKIATADSGKAVAVGTLSTVAGAIDFFNGLVQLKRAVNPDLAPSWANIRNFGYNYPPSMEVATRLIAGVIGATNAVLAGI